MINLKKKLSSFRKSAIVFLVDAWASIIGWTGGQVPPLFEVGGIMCFVLPHFLGQQMFIMCKFTIFLLLILKV